MQELDDITAGRYKEFEVIKRNKFGRNQKRMMGVDNIKIYNMKRGAAGITGRVFTAFKLISTVQRIEVLDDARRALQQPARARGGRATCHVPSSCHVARYDTLGRILRREGGFCEDFPIIFCECLISEGAFL